VLGTRVSGRSRHSNTAGATRIIATQFLTHNSPADEYARRLLRRLARPKEGVEHRAGRRHPLPGRGPEATGELSAAACYAHRALGVARAGARMITWFGAARKASDPSSTQKGRTPPRGGRRCAADRRAALSDVARQPRRAIVPRVMADRIVETRRTRTYRCSGGSIRGGTRITCRSTNKTRS